MKSPTLTELQKTVLETEAILNEQRMDEEIAGVVEAMQHKWPTAADWNVREDETVEIFDAKDNVIAKITTRELDAYYE